MLLTSQKSEGRKVEGRKCYENNRISMKLSELQQQKKKALVLFLTAGYPQLDSTVPLALELGQAGADIIELGMPFSDPLADGPVIQASSQQAIKNGITLEHILGQVKEFGNIRIFAGVNGLLKSILHYGEERFFADAANVGVDGVILPEVPLEESDRFLSLARKHHLADILLVSPATTDNEFARSIKSHQGFSIVSLRQASPAAQASAISSLM